MDAQTEQILQQILGALESAQTTFEEHESRLAMLEQTMQEALTLIVQLESKVKT